MESTSAPVAFEPDPSEDVDEWRLCRYPPPDGAGDGAPPLLPPWKDPVDELWWDMNRAEAVAGWTLTRARCSWMG